LVSWEAIGRTTTVGKVLQAQMVLDGTRHTYFSLDSLFTLPPMIYPIIMGVSMKLYILNQHVEFEGLPFAEV
jgi:hypothetical protein